MIREAKSFSIGNRNSLQTSDIHCSLLMWQLSSDDANSTARVSHWCVSHLLSSKKLHLFLSQALSAVWWTWQFPASLWLPSRSHFLQDVAPGSTLPPTEWSHLSFMKPTGLQLYIFLLLLSFLNSVRPNKQLVQWYRSYLTVSCMTRFLPKNMWFLFPHNHVTIYLFLSKHGILPCMTHHTLKHDISMI